MLLLLSSILLMSPAQVQLQDPFSPFPTVVKAEEITLVMTMVFNVTKNPEALVNGVRYKVGDQLIGGVVSRITASSMIITFPDNKTKEVLLFNQQN